MAIGKQAAEAPGAERAYRDSGEMLGVDSAGEVAFR